MEQHPLHLFNFCPLCGSDNFIVNNEKSKQCKNCGFVYYFNPSAATVAIITKDRELLVATRAFEPEKGSYDLPGGFVDLFESGEEAIKREVKEETNLEVIKTSYLFSVPNIYLYSGLEIHTLDLVYKCEVSDFSKIHARDDVKNLQFIKISELNENDFGLKSMKEIIMQIKRTNI